MKLISKGLVLALGLSVCGISSYLLYILLKKEEDEDYTDTVDRVSKYNILEIPVSNDMISVLIGRNGRNIKSIQAQSKTRINFRTLEGQTDRICTIHGTVEACSVAENLIHDFLNNQPIIETDTLFVEQQYIGRIIGHDGNNIREIAAKSGAKVNVESDRNSSKRRVIIKGTVEQIMVAKSLIEEVVDELRKTQDKIDASLAKREPRLPSKSGDSPRNIGSPKVEKLSLIPGQPNHRFEVYVSSLVDPSRFWIQLVTPKAAQLDSLVDEMTEYYRKQENRNAHVLGTINRGDLVAAVFQYDNKWYRAEVLEIRDGPTPHAELYYVDYGDIDLVPVEEVYELGTDFLELHFQAIECFLAKIDPVEGEWSTDALDKFEEWTHLAQWKKLSAKIDGYSVREKIRGNRASSPVAGVELFDVDKDCEVNIAQELVNYGFAVFKTDLPSSRATSTSNISSASNS